MNPEQEEQSQTSNLATNQSKTIPSRPDILQTSRNDLDLVEEEEKRGHSFTYEIINAPLTLVWKGLTIKPYDGSTNPDKHLNIFKTQMTLYTIDKALWCKVFPTTLQEGPLGWFTKFPACSVGSFKELTTKFITQYATSRPRHTSSLSLLNVK